MTPLNGRNFGILIYACFPLSRKLIAEEVSALHPTPKDGENTFAPQEHFPTPHDKKPTIQSVLS
jgi:hypothetical protein